MAEINWFIEMTAGAGKIAIDIAFVFFIFVLLDWGIPSRLMWIFESDADAIYSIYRRSFFTRLAIASVLAIVTGVVIGLFNQIIVACAFVAAVVIYFILIFYYLWLGAQNADQSTKSD